MMTRFAIEHLPRAYATYRVTPVSCSEARIWLGSGEVTSLVRTTELIEAIHSGLGVKLGQADLPMSLQPGDQALLISLSFSVLLAWTQGDIPPLDEDWRCLLLEVDDDAVATPPLATAMPEDIPSTN